MKRPEAMREYPDALETEKAMLSLAEGMEKRNQEETFWELCKLLPCLSAEDLMRFAPVLAAAVPEVAPMIGFDQHSPHHAYDLFTHTAYVTAQVPGDIALRWAALLHDIGKVPTFTRDETGRGHFYGHAGKSAEMADEVLRRMKAPAALREQVVTLIGLHMTRLEPDKNALLGWLERLGRENVEKLLHLQEADMCSKGVGIPEEIRQFSQIRGILAEIQTENL